MVDIGEAHDVGAVMTRAVHALQHLDTGVLVVLQLHWPP